METLNQAAEGHASHYEESYQNTVKAAFKSGAEWMRTQIGAVYVGECPQCDNNGPVILYKIDNRGFCIKCLGSLY